MRIALLVCTMVGVLVLLAGCGGTGSSSHEAAIPSAPHPQRHHYHHHHHRHASGGDAGATEQKSGGAEVAKTEKSGHPENKQEREVDRLIRQAERSGIGHDMPGLDVSMVRLGWSRQEAESFTKLLSAAGLSDKTAESVAAEVLVSEEHGTSHREAVAAGLEIYGALGGFSE